MVLTSRQFGQVFIQPPPRVVNSTPGKISHLLEFVWLSPPPPTSSGGHKLLSDDVSHTFLPTDAFSAWAPSRTQLRELLAGLLLRGGEGEDRVGEDERNSALSAGYMFHS